MTTDRREAPHHNKITCYTDYRCRRPECVARYNAYNSPRARAKRAGTWDGLVEAAAVRKHILRLQDDCGVGPTAIAAASGISKQSVIEFINPQPGKNRGRRQRTSAETAAKILAVTPDGLIGLRVNAAGTRRRLQALVAAGWPLKHIAACSELKDASVGDFMRRNVVLLSTATKVARTYDALKDRKPIRHGVDRCQARRARDWAAREKWPTPDYWADRMDVIDDPEFEPLYGVTRRELVAQDANWVMRTTGVDRATAAQRLGVSKAYVEHAFRDHPEYALGTAA
ncbi:hypothetical protein ACFU5Y_04160 [Streptomyces gardneri]|uniref:hypothetical protein n=1 Tax=Streptomyces gardneri TaxID=66892 RepID=UPI00367E1DE4